MTARRTATGIHISHRKKCPYTHVHLYMCSYACYVHLFTHIHTHVCTHDMHMSVRMSICIPTCLYTFTTPMRSRSTMTDIHTAAHMIICSILQCTRPYPYPCTSLYNSMAYSAWFWRPSFQRVLVVEECWPSKGPVTVWQTGRLACKEGRLRTCMDGCMSVRIYTHTCACAHAHTYT